MKKKAKPDEDKFTATYYLFYGALLFIAVVALMLILQVWF